MVNNRGAWKLWCPKVTHGVTHVTPYLCRHVITATRWIIFTFSLMQLLYIMQTYISLHKSSHVMEEFGFMTEWNSWTWMSNHVLNTLGLFTIDWVCIDVKKDMLVLQFIPGCKIETMFKLNQSLAWLMTQKQLVGFYYVERIYRK